MGSPRPLETAVVNRQATERVKNMMKLSQCVMGFLKEEDGPTAVEYAVMLALIIVVCIAAITTLGTNASSTFNKVATTVGSAS
jgi:pilus assembly protein Flp/PilA